MGQSSPRVAREPRAGGRLYRAWKRSRVQMQPASRGGTHPRPPRGPRAPLVPDAPFWWKAPLSPPSQTHTAFSAAPTPSASWWVLKQCYWRGPFRAAPGPDQGSVQSGQPRTQVANTPRAGQVPSSLLLLTSSPHTEPLCGRMSDGLTAGADTDLGLASLPGEEAFITACCNHTCPSNPTTSHVAWSEPLPSSALHAASV